MLRNSSAGYTTDEIAKLVPGMLRELRNAGTSVTQDIVDRITCEIDKRHSDRLAKLAKQQESERRQREFEQNRRNQQDNFANGRMEDFFIRHCQGRFQGINDRIVNRDDFKNILGDFFDLLLYKQPSLGIYGQLHSRRLPDRIYHSNIDFWRDVLSNRLYEAQLVSLPQFHITEWLPTAPGRYFTPAAEESREAAQRYITRCNHESQYLPLGKESMILGGVGCVRLAAKSIGRDVYYLLCATSNGVSHQGIPLLVSEHDYRNVIPIIREAGGCVANVFGKFKILPVDFTILDYNRDVTRCCIVTDKVLPIHCSGENEILTAVAISFFSSENDRCMMWSFCSFQNSDRFTWHDADDWLMQYARRYCNQPQILADFDEHINHFDCKIDFPLRDLFRGMVDIPTLQRRLSRVPGVNVNVMVVREIKEMYMEPKYSTSISITGEQKGQIVVGDNASLTQVWNSLRQEIELEKLSEELVDLKNQARVIARSPEEHAAADNIDEAQIAVSNGDGLKALEHLRRAGGWALDLANKIAASVAATAISRAIGL